jgi:quinol monooxygenase YgiN
MIIVIATITCQPGKRADYLAEFAKLVPEVLQEDGCIEYGPTIDVQTDLPNQNRNDDRAVIVEKWESVDALKAHLVAPHMVAFRPTVKDFVVGSELRILEHA